MRRVGTWEDDSVSVPVMSTTSERCDPHSGALMPGALTWLLESLDEHRDVERERAEISPLSTSAGGSPQPAAAQPTVGGGAPRRLYPAAGGLGRVCAKFRGETRAVRAAGAMGGGPAPAPLPRRRTDEQKELDHALLAHSM